MMVTMMMITVITDKRENKKNKNHTVQLSNLFIQKFHDKENVSCYLY